MDTGGSVSVTVTGAAGQIAYAFLPLLCGGSVLGQSMEISLTLLDIEAQLQVIEGLAMELQDSTYSLLTSVKVTTDPNEAFVGTQIAVLIGGFPRTAGMDRGDLIHKNLKIMQIHGMAIEKYAHHNCKVLVVANPANTNCLVAMKFAPSIPQQNFTALTRLDCNRMRGILATHLSTFVGKKVSPSSIRNCIIWGNHSSTQVPDASDAEVLVNGKWVPILPFIGDSVWVNETLVPLVQNRGGAVIAKRKHSSALSAANAVATHLHDWLCGSGENGKGHVSMAVLSDGNPYCIPDGLIFGFPTTCSHGSWKMVEGIPIDSPTKQAISMTIKELMEERRIAMELLNETRNQGFL